MKKLLQLIIILITLLLFSAPTKAATQPLVGVIRWDNWTMLHNMNNPNNNQQAHFLEPNPPQWYYRIPFFGVVKDNGKIELSEDQQTVVDREIRYAARAGIDYWNFSWIGAGTSQVFAHPPLEFYLKSPYKNQINFTLMFMISSFLNKDSGSQENWSATVQRFLPYLQESTYQTVLNGRSMIFFFQPERMFERDAALIKKNLKYLRDQVKTVTGKDPYFVATSDVDEDSIQLRRDLGFDALTQYGAYGPSIPRPTRQNGHTLYLYSDLMTSLNNLYSLTTDMDIPWILPATMGLDDRPREIAWPHRFPGMPNIADGTLNQKKDMIKQAIRFTKQHPSVVPTQSILIYAWNEFNEGGWLAPGLYSGDINLRAVAYGLGHNYPPPLTAAASRNNNTTTLTITGGLPANPKIQLYDMGSKLWGSQLPFTKVNDTTHTLTLPDQGNPLSACNQTKACQLTADILHGNGNYYAYVTFSLPQSNPTSNPADLNQDGKVDIYDYNILVTDFGKIGTPGWIKADIIKDGKVDIFDYNVLVENFGK